MIEKFTDIIYIMIYCEALMQQFNYFFSPHFCPPGTLQSQRCTGEMLTSRTSPTRKEGASKMNTSIYAHSLLVGKKIETLLSTKQKLGQPKIS